MRRRTIEYVALALLSVGLVGAGFALAGGSGGSGKTKIATIRPTGVGLPRIGMHGTVGAGDVVGPLKQYHDSGHYDTDLEKVAAKAEDYLDRRVPKIRKQAKQRCRERGTSPCPKPRLALVLDIDETSLSNYSDLVATDFTGTTAALTTALFAATSPPIDPTLELFDDARDQKVAVFFITGRPDLEIVRDRTEENLTGSGYSGWKQLFLKPADESGTVAYKSGARAEIEADGYRIVLNVGDQESDLKGGYADKAYKLPNPFYFISD